MIRGIDLRDRAGAPVPLGGELASGGEAVVYHVIGNASHVAKIYLKPPSNVAEAKLRAMVSLGIQSPLIRSFVAWPTEILVDARTRQLRGFLMQKVVGHHELHQLYSPLNRSQLFPFVTFKFLVHTAWNICFAFREIHKAGIVVGDVNARNLLISQKGTTFLLDCDSMGFSSNSDTYPCSPVGMEEFLPAELHRDLAGFPRVQNHDLFSVAVLIFQLLFCGRHPYSGRLAAGMSGDPPTPGAAIRAGEFAYSRKRRGCLEPLPGFPPLAFVGDRCADLFERAFSNSTTPIRPTAGEWFDALGDLRRNLKTCSQSEDHAYLNTLRECPWCHFHRVNGIDLFVGSMRRLDTWSPDQSKLPQLIRDYESQFARLLTNLGAVVQLPNAVFPNSFSIEIPPIPKVPGPRPSFTDFRRKVRDEPVLLIATVSPPSLLPYPIRPQPPQVVLQKQSKRSKTPDSYTENLASTLFSRRSFNLGMVIVASLICSVSAWFESYIVSVITLLIGIGSIFGLNRIRKSPVKLADDGLSVSGTASMSKNTDPVSVQLEFAKFELAEANWRREYDKVHYCNTEKTESYRRQLEEAEQLAKARYEQDLQLWRREEDEANTQALLMYQAAESHWQLISAEYRKNVADRDDCLQRAREEVNRLQLRLANAKQQSKNLGDRYTQAIDDLRRSFADVLQTPPPEIERQMKVIFDEYRSKATVNLTTSTALDAYLATIHLSNQITGVGGGELYLTLIRSGIRTAADCQFNRLVDIPKIGVIRANTILAWKQTIIAVWQRSQTGQSPQSKHQLNREYGLRSRKLEQSIVGFTNRIIQALVTSKIEDLRAAYTAALREERQCEADLAVCPPLS